MNFDIFDILYLVWFSFSVPFIIYLYFLWRNEKKNSKKGGE